jgi:hypothetical protein
MKLNLPAAKAYILARLREASTYRGLVLILTALGVKLSPDESEAITIVGLALSGLLGVTLTDNRKGG